MQIQIQIQTEMHACAMFAFILDMYFYLKYKLNIVHTTI